MFSYQQAIIERKMSQVIDTIYIGILGRYKEKAPPHTWRRGLDNQQMPGRAKTERPVEPAASPPGDTHLPCILLF